MDGRRDIDIESDENPKVDLQCLLPTSFMLTAINMHMNQYGGVNIALIAFVCCT